MAEPLLIETCPPGGAIAHDQAIDLILQHASKPVTERCPLSEAPGRVSAAAVSSPVALPSFDNAAMDGYALPAGDFEPGTVFPVQGRRAAGDNDLRSSLGGAAWEVMTGARLPLGLVTMVPLEQVDVVRRDLAGNPARIRLSAAVRHGQHVRRIGEDVAQGQVVLEAATRLQAAHTMLLAGLGVAEVAVARRPRVAVICTGRELVDDPAQALQPGQIRNANRPFLSTRLQAAGAERVHVETVADDLSAWNDAVQRAVAARAEVVISTGAVSTGRHDFVPGALEQCGAQILFHKVAIRPGKPLLCARLPNGALYFGLPGNPVAAAVGLRFFVEPALRVMLGLPAEAATWLPLAEAVGRPRPGLRHHLKARLALDGDGRCTVAALAGQEPFRLLPLTRANCWVVLPEQEREHQAGDRVQVYPMGHEQSLFGADV